MSYFDTTETFADGQQVTSTNLNGITINLRLGSDSVDGTTVTLNSGALSVGVLGPSNYGAGSIPSVALANAAVTSDKIALTAVTTTKIALAAITDSRIAAEALTWGKTLTADRAGKTDMQSQSADHFVSPDVAKYHPGVVKAYGRVSLVNGSATLTGAFGVASATDTGSARQITLSVAMANTDYTVVALANGGANPVNYTIDSTTQFTLSGVAEATGREMSFMVLGQLSA